MAGDIVVKSGFRVRSGHPTLGGVAAAGAAGVALVGDAPRFMRRMRVNLNNVVVPITAALDYGSVALINLPDGQWLFNASHPNFSITRDGTGIVAATDVSWGIGQAAASNATLSLTMIDIHPLTVFTDNVLTDSVDASDGATSTILALTASSDSLYLNFAAGLSADGFVTVNGDIDIFGTHFERP